MSEVVVHKCYKCDNKALMELVVKFPDKADEETIKVCATHWDEIVVSFVEVKHINPLVGKLEE